MQNRRCNVCKQRADCTLCLLLIMLIVLIANRVQKMVHLILIAPV